MSIVEGVEGSHVVRTGEVLQLSTGRVHTVCGASLPAGVLETDCGLFLRPLDVFCGSTVDPGVYRIPGAVVSRCGECGRAVA